jgi:hypothetical protein
MAVYNDTSRAEKAAGALRNKTPEELTAINLAAALELGAGGVPVFPAELLWNGEKGKFDKKPCINGWKDNATNDSEVLKRWWDQYPYAVPGIALGKAGLIVIDPDRHPGAADGVAALKELLGDRILQPTPTTKTAGNGFHFVYRQPDGEPLGNGTGSLPPGIDVRGAGGWAVAPGATVNGGRWRGVKDRPRLSEAYKAKTIPVLPDFIATLIRTPKAHNDKTSAGTNGGYSGEKASREKVKSALGAITNNLSREEWVNIGYAVYDAIGDAGRDLFVDWSATWSGYKPELLGTTIKQWQSFAQGHSIKDKTLWWYASQRGWRWNDNSQKDGERATSQSKPKPPAWPVLDDAAYHGLAGEIVRLLEPHTEADPVGILVQLLATFGNVIGHSPYYLVESDRHHANLFAVLVGTSAKGRKGTSGGRVRAVLKDADEAWCTERCVSGLSSGEGLINAVRDEVKKWNTKESCEELVDPGVHDKRLMVTEQEFAGALAVMERHGNNLSPVIRNAWDGLRLQTITKNSPLVATGSHISIVGHITDAETRKRLTRTDIANGFANRFLFCCVKRSRFLPHGGNLDESELLKLNERIREAVDFARSVGRVTMTKAAAEVWTLVYPELSAERSGLIGAIIARAEAQCIRLALIFALLDNSFFIDVAHLRAAIAIWGYCEQSAIHIFGDSLGDPIADEILLALRRSPEGMTRTAISSLFSHHSRADQIGIALAALQASGRARLEMKSSGGRPAETWFAVEGTGP